MNLIEAHKSGRRWRLPDWDEGRYATLLDSTPISYRIVDGNYLFDYPVTKEELCSDNYILEPEAKLLTKEDVKKAFMETYFAEREYVGRLDALLDILFEEAK